MCPRRTRVHVPICPQVAAVRLGASPWLRHRPGGAGSSRWLFPRVPHSARAQLARPLKRWKILLSAHSSPSVKLQSIQQQSSVVWLPAAPQCLRSHLHGKVSRSPWMDITFRTPDLCHSCGIQLSPQSHLQHPAVGCEGWVCREGGWGAVG